MLTRLLTTLVMAWAPLAMAAGPESWIPIRWWDPAPKSIELLKGTPINCLLLATAVRNDALVREARRRGLTVLALASNAGEARQAARETNDG
ncbi:MAG TPA: hypothetical protein VGL72_02490, partial [Bryobacteraceae bacterium]